MCAMSEKRTKTSASVFGHMYILQAQWLVWLINNHNHAEYFFLCFRNPPLLSTIFILDFASPFPRLRLVQTVYIDRTLLGLHPYDPTASSFASPINLSFLLHTDQPKLQPVL